MTESYGERKVKKLFEKVFDSSKNLVLKNVSYDFQLIETDRGSPKNLNQFRLIEKQPRLIEIPEKAQF